MNRELNTQDILRLIKIREHGFDVQDGGLVAIKEGKKGTVVKPLANFWAWPTRKISRDDGAAVTTFYDIAGKLPNGKVLPTARLTHEEFFGNLSAALNRKWGMQVIIKPRAKDDLREALQILAGNCVEERIYTHTGWRKLDNKWVFLHTNGAVGAANVKVDLSEGGSILTRYVLPTKVEDPKAAVGRAFELLDIAAPEIAYPLFAAAFFAPLCEVLRPHSLQSDFMLFLIGRTQSGKSSLAALFLSLFGNFDKNNFPANYRQTANSLERTSFLLKDSMMIVDDFFPGQSHQEREKMKEIAQRLARAYGDGAVRQRMQGKKLQEAWLPRGVAISTGEERPEIGESGQARFVFIDVKRSDVDYDKLIDLQQNHKGQLAECMMLYTFWISENWERIPVIFNDTYQKAKALFVNEVYGGRINESMAKLCGAMEVALSFAKDQGYITKKLYEIRGVKAYQAFQTVFEHNISSLVDEKPSRKFLNAMGEIMQQIPERFCETTTHVASQDVLGCYDEQYLYLLPTASFKAVQEHTSATGNSFPVGDKTLWKHLRAEGIIETSNSRARNTVQLRLNCFGGRNVDVLKIERKHFEITE